MKKDDKLWITAVCICDVLLCLAFFALLFGWWVPNQDSPSDAFSFGRLCFLQVFVQMLNMVGIDGLLGRCSPDGAPLLPIPQKAQLALNIGVLLAFLLLGKRTSIQPDSPSWLWLLPGVGLSAWFFALLGIGLFRLHRRNGAGLQ